MSGNVQQINRPVEVNGVRGAIPLVRELTITHEDLDAEATSQVIDIGDPLPAGAEVLAVTEELTEVFAGGDVSACALIVGDADDDDRWLTTGSIFTGATIGRKRRPGAGNASASGVQLQARINATNGNVADLESGSVTVRVLYAVV